MASGTQDHLRTTRAQLPWALLPMATCPFSSFNEAGVGQAQEASSSQQGW